MSAPCQTRETNVERAPISGIETQLRRAPDRLIETNVERAPPELIADTAREGTKGADRAIRDERTESHARTGLREGTMPRE